LRRTRRRDSVCNLLGTVIRHGAEQLERRRVSNLTHALSISFGAWNWRYDA
jgi:hypothetical protein